MSRIQSVLPSDFDIFSAFRFTNPLWDQQRTKGLPVAPSAWAISFSWCGKIRSSPPPWKSKLSPRYCMAMAEHSMCQPGRPGPHGEVQGISLALVHVHAGSRLELVEVLSREPAVSGEAADLEVDVAVKHVGDPSRDQSLDEDDHLGDVLGRLGLHVRWLDADGRHVLLVLRDVPLRDGRGGHALLIGPSDDAVVHVGVVLDEGDLVVAEAQVAPHHVENDGAPRMPDVAEIVHGHSAHVHARLAGHQGHELLLAPGERVEDAQGHHGTSTLATARAAIPSPRPSRPRCSGLLALTLTCSAATFIVPASRSAMAGRCGARRGA